MTYEEQVEKYGSISKAARAAGIPATTFRDRLTRELKGVPQQIHDAKEAPRGISAEELLLKHSPEHKIMHAAKETPRGTFYVESDFIRRIGITGGYKHIVEREEFSDYRGRAAGSVFYWGHPDSIASMKADGVLR